MDDDEGGGILDLMDKRLKEKDLMKNLELI